MRERARECLSRRYRSDWLHPCQVTGVLSNDPPWGGLIGCSVPRVTGKGRSSETGCQGKEKGPRTTAAQLHLENVPFKNISYCSNVFFSFCSVIGEVTDVTKAATAYTSD